MPSELASPWRLRWEGRRQLQLHTQKKVGQNFPSSRQINKLAACPVEGPRASALPNFLSATREGAPRTGRCPANLPKLPGAPLTRLGPRVPDSAPRPEHERWRSPFLLVRCPRKQLTPLIAGRHSLSVKDRFPCPCRIWASHPPRNRVGKRSLHVIHSTHGGASE